MPKSRLRKKHKQKKKSRAVRNKIKQQLNDKKMQEFIKYLEEKTKENLANVVRKDEEE